MIISAISGNMYKKMTYSDLLKNIKEEKVETIQIEEDNKTASVKIKDDSTTTGTDSTSSTDAAATDSAN